MLCRGSNAISKLAEPSQTRQLEVADRRDAPVFRLVLFLAPPREPEGRLVFEGPEGRGRRDVRCVDVCVEARLGSFASFADGN